MNRNRIIAIVVILGAVGALLFFGRQRDAQPKSANATITPSQAASSPFSDLLSSFTGDLDAAPISESIPTSSGLPSDPDLTGPDVTPPAPIIPQQPQTPTLSRPITVPGINGSGGGNGGGRSRRRPVNTRLN